MVEWAHTQSGLLQGRRGQALMGSHRPTRVSEELALYLLPRLAGYFSGAALALSPITSYCCREGLLHQELFVFPAPS